MIPLGEGEISSPESKNLVTYHFSNCSLVQNVSLAQVFLVGLEDGSIKLHLFEL